MGILGIIALFSCVLFVVRVLSALGNNKPKAIVNFVIVAILFAVFIYAAARADEETATNAKAACAAVEARAVSIAGRWQCVR